MHRTNKIRLYPTNEQASLLARSVGVARFAYNWGLREWKRMYEAGEKPSAYTLIKRLNAVKREQFPWMLEVSKMVPQYALHHLQTAFTNFFAKRAKYPNPKAKGQRDSFTIHPESAGIKVDGNFVHIPRVGKVRMAEPLHHQGRILKATISRTAGRWHISIPVELPESTSADKALRRTPECENQAAVGVDLGLKHFATLSTGEKIDNPKYLIRSQRRLALSNRKLSRRQKGGKNRAKARMQLARRHAQVVNQRKSFLNGVTADLSCRSCGGMAQSVHPKKQEPAEATTQEFALA